MKYRFSWATILILAAISIALPEGKAWAGSKKPSASGDRNDAIVLYDSMLVSMDAAGIVSKRRHREVVLFTDNAIGRYGDPRILFDSQNEELRILKARVRMRDGSTVDTEANGINQTTPFALALAPDYTGLQETVVTHVGIEKGCTAELEYEIRRIRPAKHLSGVEIFSSEDSTRLRVLAVRLPENRELHWVCLNGAPEPRRSGDSCVWTLDGIPGRTPYDGGAWEGDYFPAVVYSTASSPGEIFADIASQIAAASSPFDAIEPIVKEAMASVSSDEEKILAIHRRSLELVRDVHAPFSLLSCSPRSAERIYDTGYAAPLDRAVLLCAMLRSAGFAIEPVLVSSGRSFSEKAVAADIFGSILVSVTGKDCGEMFLDPLSRYERDPSCILAGKTIMRLGEKPSLVRLPTLLPSTNNSSIEIELSSLEDGTMKGRGKATLEGIFSPYFIVRNGKGLDEFLRSRVERLFGGAHLEKWNSLYLDRKRAEVEFEFEVELKDEGKGSRSYMPFPLAFDAELAGVERVRLERLVVPDAIELVPCTLNVSCSIDIPRGWKLVALPPEASVENEVGSAEVTIEEMANGRRNVSSKLVIKRDLVLPVFYSQLKTLVSSIKGGLVVLERD